MKAFDLINTPLDGSHLLEASAGTGKTFSLSFLYLRLLLEKQLRVEEIVVATFTNAATAELKQRIYARLFEAESALKQLVNNEIIDDKKPLHHCLVTMRKHISDDELYKRLRLAQTQFDRAHIHSINGFALQLLHENAVTLGQTIPEEILNNDVELIKTIYLQVAHDNFAALGAHAKAVAKAVSTLSSNDLFLLLANMHTHYQALRNAETQFPNVETAQRDFDDTVTTILNDKSALNAAIEAVISAIEAGYLNKASYKIDKINAQKQQLLQLSTYQPENVTLLSFFSQKKLLASRVKAGEKANITFDHPVFIAFDKLCELSPLLRQAHDIEFYRCLILLLDVIRKRLHAEKADKMVLTHDDVVRIVANGADKLQLPLKAALLDEAQDTNTAQLTLFKKLFLQRGHICFFVGDPKQAIYGFRGGDVYTYLAIRDSVTHKHRLPKNYRSTQAFNESINCLFENNPFADTGIDYQAIDWDKNNDESDFGNTSLSLIPSPSKKIEDITDTAADCIIELLQAGHNVTDNGKQRPLNSADVAILVRGKTQAAHIKNALAQRGLATSYTGKNSIYSTDEALLMHALLQAIGSGNVRHVKTLMLTPLFDYSNQALLDDYIVNPLRQQLHQYNKRYQQHGFANMFYSFMHDHHVGGRLLQLSDGKRRLSNWIQLFELLQQALQSQSLGLMGINDWLLRRINDNDNETELRLEDQNAVSIMTMHSAKGLEFKVVCLPYFNYQPSKRTKNEDILISHRRQLAALSRLKIPKISEPCQAEQEQEEMRLAYVALTRATYQNIIVEQPITDKNNTSRDNSMWAKLKRMPNSPINDEPFSATKQPQSDEKKIFNQQYDKDFIILELGKKLRPKWLMTSFSGLQQRMSHGEYHLTPTSNNRKNNEPTLSPSALMSFPAGAKAGVILHTLYENYMLIRRCDSQFIADIEKELSTSRLQLQTDSQSLAPQLAQDIASTATVKLYPKSFCLNDISVAQQSIEMAFFIHLSPTSRQHLYRHFGEDIDSDIDGYLHGFIDYWFTHQGQFYILDYKSNKLGETPSDYHQDAMQQAMDEHRYDLQALIYTLALCKHLGIYREQDYTAIGGYYYLFIRAMPIPQANDNADNGIYYNQISWDLLAPLLADLESSNEVVS